MKKNFIRAAALIMTGALLFMACQKNAKPNKPNGNDDPKENEDPSGEQGDKPAIILDGSFSDWDAITEAVADKNDYVAVAKGGDGDPIKTFKVASTEDAINFYIEFQADLLPQNESSGTWGSSYSENTLVVGEDDDEFREVMHLFIDPDANKSTGFYTFADPETEDVAIADLGCEMCAQFFMYFKPSASTVNVAFEQTLVGPTKTGTPGEDDMIDGDYTGVFDYNGTICQDEWPDSGDNAAFPLWGWQNPDDSGTGDNDCPLPTNWKSGKAESSGIVKVEFCVMKEDIVNLNDNDEEFSCGIIFNWGESYQKIGSVSVAYVK